MKYSNEEILKSLREHPNVFVDEWRKKKMHPCDSTVINRFGSWNRARKMAGVPVKKYGGARKFIGVRFIDVTCNKCGAFSSVVDRRTDKPRCGKCGYYFKKRDLSGAAQDRAYERFCGAG
jgi:ribosomal protein S27AE